MNQEEFPIYPNIKRIVNICKFKYQIVDIKLFESIRIAVYLFDDKDIMIEARQYQIIGDEYSAWSNDDTYLIKLIKDKIQKEFNVNI